jgi:hypothetical protein
MAEARLSFKEVSNTILIQFFPFLKCVYIFWHPLYISVYMNRCNNKRGSRANTFVLAYPTVVTFKVEKHRQWLIETGLFTSHNTQEMR